MNPIVTAPSALVATITAPLAVKMLELSELQSKAATLSTEVETERSNALRELPAAFGFTSASEFVDAFNAANRASKRKARKSTKVSATNGERKTRVTITPERREEIKAFFKAGKSTLEAVAKFDISLATAQNLKKDAGMVKERS